MPIYEYTCDGCRTDFEMLVRGGEQPQCPTCGGTKLAKQFSVPAAHVAGSSLLPVRSTPMPGGGCGLPQCGTGRCAGME
ncbi:MAG: zinc ribbon domain-containing protein [Planctomycetota bacterium]